MKAKHVCDGCGTEYEEDELDPIEDESMRVEPGGMVPSGQCPDEDCEALCFPKEDLERLGTTITVDLKKLRVLLVAWHMDEDCGAVDASIYAEELIERMRKECEAK